ncbi:hypothetical protein GCM10028803_59470 [Larkinella knui]|uniref:DUF4421 domain-containing protein n=1 Tax=Larkinella knui TaxID=2025310 RepID=A0A3P1CAP2_9BACT|nr:DUF4421 family protein [Larkinella knui]RRB10300.1 DUF4421 domain-containing protein [Larkinella knui]
MKSKIRFWRRFGGVKILLGLVIQAGLCPFVRAQTDADTTRKEIIVLGISLDTLLKARPPKVDTNYITSYYAHLHLRLIAQGNDYFLQLIGPTDHLTYKPNGASSLGVGVSYSWLSLELTSKVPYVNRNLRTAKGETKQFGTSLSYNGRRVWVNTKYQSYQGLYLNNPDVLEKDWFTVHSQYPQRPDLESRIWYSSLYYCFNHRQFSNPASQMQRERQKKSAGSFLVGATLLFTQIKGDSSLFPHAVRPLFPSNANLTQYRSFSYSINAGYIRTIVFRTNFFTTLLIRPGISLHNASSVSTGENTRSLPVRVGMQGDSRVTVGYNTDRYFAGATYSVVFLSGNLEGASVLRSYKTDIRFVIGMHFPFKPKGLLHRLPGF